jgi:hypothetical protein
MANHHFYEQSVTTWNREWVNDGPDMVEMTEEEESAFSVEMDAVNAEAAEYRKQEQGQMNVSLCLSEIEFDLDAAF